MNKEYVLEKLAFFAVTPFDVANQQELESGKGYFKEMGNRLAGGVTGAMVGGAPLGLLGGALQANRPGGGAGKATIAAAILAALAGAYTGDVRSLRQTEREAGVKPTGVGKYLGRAVGSTVGSAVVPGVGGLLGDYLVSRQIQKYQKA